MGSACGADILKWGIFIWGVSCRERGDPKQDFGKFTLGEVIMEQIENMMGFMPDWAVGPVLAASTIIVGYFIAKIAGMIVSGGINKTGLGRKAMTTGGNIGKSISKAVF